MAGRDAAKSNKDRLAEQFPEGPIAAVIIEGLHSIAEEKVRDKLLSRVGRPIDRKVLNADVKTLNDTHWFSNVAVEYSRASDNQGLILYFKVVEKQIITEIRYEGLSKLTRKEIEKTTQIKVGGRANWPQAQMAVRQIQGLYTEKGYDFARVELVEGGNPGDTRIHFRIFEGPKSHIGRVEFVGNTVFVADLLRTKVGLGSKFLGLIPGTFRPEEVEQDVRKLVEFYQNVGYMDAQVTPILRRGAKFGDVRLTFVIDEGIQYKVRKVIFEGDASIPGTKVDLKEGLQLHSGKPFEATLREADLKSIRDKFHEYGYIDMEILPDLKATEKAGLIDVVYRISRGSPYNVAEINIHGNERTRAKVIYRELLMAGIEPGGPLNMNRLEIGKKRLVNTRYFASDPQSNKQIEIKAVNKRDADQPYAEPTVVDVEDLVRRMQSPDEPPAAGNGPTNVALMDDPQVSPAQGGGGVDGNAPPPAELPPAPPIRGRRPARPRAAPFGANTLPGTFPSIPGTNTTDVGPDRNEPFNNRAFSTITQSTEAAEPRKYADLDVNVEEGPTGNLMLGVTANSFQGLFGSLILQERNFDITRLPRNFSDIYNGTAFRGGGQELSVQLMPGNLINFADVTFREPYLFNQPIGLTTSGYAFTRLYPDFNERRVGGRFSLGKQFGTQTYADVAMRVEDVTFNGYRTPAPADYLAASGHTFLASLRPSLRFDNRNNPIMPSRGSYAEFAFEQGWGNFTFSKVTAEGRQHFTLRQRPDGSGPHILTLRGVFGVTGPDTPVYERFFAGDFRSFRGFYYRGVGPHVDGVNVGGLMEAIGSVEYQFPLLANDMLHQVFFTDFGTVERGYSIQNFRASIGTGIRIVIPQFKVPIAFDFAIPVEHAPGDRTRNFHFFLGAMW